WLEPTISRARPPRLAAHMREWVALSASIWQWGRRAAVPPCRLSNLQRGFSGFGEKDSASDALSPPRDDGGSLVTVAQIMAFAIVGLMMAAFIWGRLRYDLVASGALLVAVVAGIVPADRAFSGFSDDIVIIVGSALLASAAVSRSGVMEWALMRIAPNIVTPRVQLLILVTTVATLSAFVKNI